MERHGSRSRARAVVAALVMAALAGCGGGDDAGDAAGGAPGDPSEADRTIEISAHDDLSFDPESVTVEVGETVTFVVTNEGRADHEFVLGSRPFQEDHGGAGGHAGHEANAVHLSPGGTAELTWSFESAGTLLYACHVNGHYGSGMYGTIRVE